MNATYPTPDIVQGTLTGDLQLLIFILLISPACAGLWFVGYAPSKNYTQSDVITFNTVAKFLTVSFAVALADTVISILLPAWAV